MKAQYLIDVGFYTRTIVNEGTKLSTRWSLQKCPKGDTITAIDSARNSKGNDPPHRLIRGNHEVQEAILMIEVREPSV